MDALHVAVAAGSAFLAGGINSVAGGGTLVTFPSLIWLGLSPVTANATSTVAIWPGSLGGLLGYRREVRTAEPRLLALVAPSMIGGICGALLLRWTPPAVFAALVPYLILFATLLFAAGQRIQQIVGSSHHEPHRSAKWLAGAIAFQFLVALYGGYFGAGIGILMLAALSILGLDDIHQMNGLKNFFGMCINGVAAVYFMWAGMVNWLYVVAMAVAAIAGGYACAGLARRVGRKAVRWAVICVGVGMAVSLFFKR